MYLDLYCYDTGFMIKGTSYHYNAGIEKTLCEVKIPNTTKNTKDILSFIAENHFLYPWAKVALTEAHANDQLIAFIEEHI